MITTIEDIRNADRPSGFHHVNSATGGRMSARRNVQLWRAEAGRSAKAGVRDGWRGPTRHTPEEAAQDYVDYVRTGGRVPVEQARHEPLPYNIGMPAEYRNRSQRQPAGPADDSARTWFAYSIYVIDSISGLRLHLKIGVSTNPDRWRSLTTAGFGVEPHKAARPCADEAEARAIEQAWIHEAMEDEKYDHLAAMGGAGHESFAVKASYPAQYGWVTPPRNHLVAVA